MEQGELYRKAVAVKVTPNNIDFEYEYYRIIDWWNEEFGLKYCRIENINTGVNYDINVDLLKLMEKVDSNEN